MTARPPWFPDWSGKPAVLVASGPSASAVELDRARGLAHVLAINESWRLAPWADAVYGADFRFWLAKAGLPDFAGLKITGEERAARDWPDIHAIKLRRGFDRIVTDELGVVGWGGNSGFHAVNLAVQFGARRLVLVGYDMHVEAGLHWHGPHPKGFNNPNPKSIERWRRMLDAVALDLAGLGVGVINCSPSSALKAYARMPLDEALGLTVEAAPC